MSETTYNVPKKPIASKELLDDQLIVRSGRKKRTRSAGWYSKLSPRQQSIVSWVGIGVGVSLVAVLAGLAARTVYRDLRSKSEEGKSFGTDKYATWAKQIYKALKLDTWTGLGTDEVMLRRTIRAIPTQADWHKTVQSYKRMYKGRGMTKDIAGDLSTTEYNEMIAIVNAKPATKKDIGKPNRNLLLVNWAKRIYAALNYATWGFMWGTDEDAVKAVFMEYRTQQDYWGTKKKYYTIYGSNMFKDLKADMDDIHHYMKIVWRKPKTIKQD